mgnify:CR=1 FL=1
MVITLADDSTTTVSIQNGKGISSIAKTGTSGLVDTYTITYNDATTQTFTVTNGAKGDTGDAWYVWIKYAGSMPTQDSDMGDTPDNWIGIYSGTSSTAPTHYTDYDWFEYKGEKGDTGDAAVITTQTVGYQTSNSGTVVPSGSWTTTIPTVPPGSFLWTRTQLAFNDGSVVTAYSVSRFGIDGTGSVSTVNSISPDGNGNVALTADDIPLTNNVSVEDTIDQIEIDVGNVANLTTSASNCVDAINELKTASNKALTGEPQTRIPSGSNFNNYTTAGTYYVYSDSDATSISNMPQSASGTLFCVYRGNSSSYLMQIYVTTSSVQRVWTRLYNNGTWTRWLQNGGHIVITGTVTTSSGGTASLQETYNTDEWGLVSISAVGAVSGYVLIPYKYGDAANGRWGFFARYSGSMNPIASTSISYRAVLLHL